MKCLENLIGISATDCLCTLDGLSEAEKIEVKKSVSGLYLDRDLPGGVNISEIKTLDACGLYFRLAKEAITSAQKRFEGDIEIALSEKYKNQKTTFRGELGRMTFASVLNKTKNFQFMQIVPNQLSDGIIKLYGGRVIVNENDTLSVHILAQKGDGVPQVIHTTTVEVLANKFTGFTLPETTEFPLTIDGQKMYYYFVWEGSAGTKARDNGVSCNCSGGNGYDSYISLKGGESDNLNELSGSDSFAHGFSLDVEIKCDTGRLICREFDSQNKIAVASAWANLYKAGELLIEKVLSSSEISRITLMNRDYLYGKRNHFRAEYEKRILYLSYEIDVTKGDCFICQNRDFFVGNVFG